MNKIYLCKPTGIILGVLNGIEEISASLKESISDLWELRFEVNRYVSVNGELVQTNYYESINEMMELLLEDIENNKKYRFLIDNEPEISGDGKNEKKSITAHSIECELQNKFLRGFKINCGTSSSQEYLVGKYRDDDKNKEFLKYNINPYTQLPIDYIVVQNNYKDIFTAVKEYLQSNSNDWNINTTTGQITNTSNVDIVSYLVNLYNTYPRLSCDTYYAIDNVASSSTYGSYICKCISYLYTVANPASKVMDIYMTGQIDGQTEKLYTKERFFASIDKLISYYTEYGSQLSLINLALEKVEMNNWSVGEVPDTIKNKYFTFSLDNAQDVLSFFKETCTQAMKVIFDFDRYSRKVNIIDITNTDKEHDTGVVITFRNLMKSFSVKEASDEGAKTKYKPTGGNNLNVQYVNFGEDYIVNLDYFMNKINEYGEYQYVTKELRDKYFNWKKYRDEDKYTYNSITYDSRRKAYSSLTKQYNELIIKVDEIKNRVPNDGCKVDYTTYSFKELCTAYTAYINALGALEKLYMNDVGAVSFNASETKALDINGKECLSIKETMYWYDFDSYYNTIIPNVLNALKMYVKTDEQGNFVTASKDANGNWVEVTGGNSWYNADATRVSKSKTEAYIYDMSLYGIIELKNKKKAWLECSASLYKSGFILVDGKPVADIPADNVNYTYNTPDDTGWALLKDNNGAYDYQKNFTSKDSYIKNLNSYFDYVSTIERDNSLIGTTSKGVIELTKEAIDKLQKDVDTYTASMAEINTEREKLAKEVDLLNGTAISFTNAEKVILNTLLREADYSNDNILTTNLNDIATTVEVQEELYQDTLIALSEKSQPQLSFSTELDNLFALKDFECMNTSVNLYNYIRIAIGLYQEDIIKLRIINIERNPLIYTTDLTIEFSNMTYSLSGISDLAYLIGQNSNGSSSGSSSSSSSSSTGTYGNNDAEITITNNMLNALLKNNNFNTAIGSSVVNNIVTNSNNLKTLIATELNIGNTKITGDDITTGAIKSTNYVVNGAGIKIDLDDGTISSKSFNIDSKGNAIFSGDIEGLNVTGATIKSSSISCGVTSNNVYTENFSVSSDGALVAKNATINGIINATGGTFGGNISSTAIITGGSFISQLDSDKTTIHGGKITINAASINSSTKQISHSATDTFSSGLEIYANKTDVVGYHYNKITYDGLIIKDQSFLGDYEAPTSSLDYADIFSANAHQIVFDYVRGDAMSTTNESDTCVYSSDGMNGYGSCNNGDGNGTVMYCYRMNSGGICNTSCYNPVSMTSPLALYVNSNGVISAKSSSKRYKQDINPIKDFDSHGLYNLTVVQYRYNAENGGGNNSELQIGLIAEDVEKYFPKAARWNIDHTHVETWEQSDIIPAMLKLIQEQHKDIELLKSKIK